jgi:hypothetical protein
VHDRRGHAVGEEVHEPLVVRLEQRRGQVGRVRRLVPDPVLDHPALDRVPGQAGELGRLDDGAPGLERGLDDPALGGEEVEVVENDLHVYSHLSST